jgi:hypothetical protein
MSRCFNESQNGHGESQNGTRARDDATETGPVAPFGNGLVLASTSDGAVSRRGMEGPVGYEHRRFVLLLSSRRQRFLAIFDW